MPASASDAEAGAFSVRATQICASALKRLRSMMRATRSSTGSAVGLKPPLCVMFSGNTQLYSPRLQLVLGSQVFMHQVSAVRLGTNRHSTQAPSGQVSASQAKTVQ